MCPVEGVDVLAPVRDTLGRDVVPRLVVVVLRVDRVAQELVADHLKQDVNIYV